MSCTRVEGTRGFHMRRRGFAPQRGQALAPPRPRQALRSGEGAGPCPGRRRLSRATAALPSSCPPWPPAPSALYQSKSQSALPVGSGGDKPCGASPVPQQGAPAPQRSGFSDWDAPSQTLLCCPFNGISHLPLILVLICIPLTALCVRTCTRTRAHSHTHTSSPVPAAWYPLP